RAVERIVIAAVDVTEQTYVGRRASRPVPAIAAQWEYFIGKAARRAEEEFAHARLAVRQAIAKKAQQTRESSVTLRRIVRVGIERVVDRYASPRAVRYILIDHRFAAAVGKHHVIAGNQLQEGIQWVAGDPLQRCGCIDVPENDAVSRPALQQQLSLEKLIVDPYSACLDENVRCACGLQSSL